MIKHPSELSTYQSSGRKANILISEKEVDSKVSALYVEFEPGGGTPVHTHDGIELMFVLEGEGVAIENDEKTPIKKDSMMVAPKGVPHAIVNGEDEPMLMLCVYVPPLPDSYIKENYEKID